MFSSKTINALVLLQLAATSCHLGEAINAPQHRQAKHTSPSPEPTSEPTSTATGAPISVDLYIVDGGSSKDGSTGTANGTSEYALNANNVWKAASSPPIAQTTSSPEMPKGDIVTTDAAMLGSMAVDQSNMDKAKAETTPKSVAAPIYALRHGRGIFAITGGTGCYKGARGQAQANFGIQSSRIDLFVPSISWIFDGTDDIGLGPQDTSWKKERGNGRRLDRRLQSPQECHLLREGVDSFTIMSLNLERRSNPPENKHVKDSSTSYHEHGEFQAQEQWFEGVSGEYTLSCVHHECKLFFYFGIGPSTDDFSSTTRERRNLLNDEGGKDGNDQIMTSLNLQGTTELAFQGPDVEMLVCIENCQVGGSTYNAKIEVDAEHYEAVNVRNFDNTDNLIQLDSHGKGSSAKGTKAPKASKGTIFVNTNECLVLSQACSDGGKGKGKGGSKGTIGCTDAGKGKGKGGSKGSKSSYGPSAYENAPDGTVCTGGTCSSGVCVASALAAPAAGGAAAALLLPQNNPPLPTDDLYSFVGGQNSDVVYTDEVLLNDSDPDSDPLNVVAVNQDSNSVGRAIILPSGASLTVEADGSFLYDPGNFFNYLHTGDTATETFEYTVSDGQRNTDVATVTIVLEGNNDPPMAADDTETTTEDMTVSSSVLLNDSDPEGDTIRLVVDTMNGSSGNVGQEITLPSGAKVFLTSDGLYTFDPNGQYESLNDSETALVTFEYTITDGFGGTAGATATIVISGVNDPPVAENDDLGPAPAGLPVTYNLLTNDVNPEQQDELMVTEVEGQSIGSSGSTTISLSSGALLTIDGSTGEMTVDPNGQFDSLNGSQTATITFEYIVADGNGATDSAIVTLTLLGRDTDEPSSMPSAPPSTTPCVASYYENQLLNNGEPDPDFGNLLSCGSDEDCGGVVFTDPITGIPETLGGSCDQQTRQCVCNEEYCLARDDRQSSDDTSCKFQCDCKEKCLFPGNWTGSPTASASDRCGGQCADCSNEPCEDPDTDCIEQADGSFICVDSGICTAAKDAMCDNAYQAMTGSNNNRAKCCPSTSGCIKGTMGVIATATCGNVCGTSCLGEESNPGNADGYSPSTFCIFGSRVLNMAYCPVIEDANNGNTQVWGCESTVSDKQDLLCCSGAWDGSGALDPVLGTDYGGLFNCTAEYFGYMSSNIFSPNGTQVCIDKVESLTGVAGRITPLCDAV